MPRAQRQDLESASNSFYSNTYQLKTRERVCLYLSWQILLGIFWAIKIWKTHSPLFFSLFRREGGYCWFPRRINRQFPWIFIYSMWHKQSKYMSEAKCREEQVCESHNPAESGQIQGTHTLLVFIGAWPAPKYFAQCVANRMEINFGAASKFLDAPICIHRICFCTISHNITDFWDVSGKQKLHKLPPLQMYLTSNFEDGNDYVYNFFTYKMTSKNWTPSQSLGGWGSNPSPVANPQTSCQPTPPPGITK